MARVRTWTRHEDDFLREHYENEKNAEIANVLGRSALSVEKRAGKLQLKKSRDFFSRMADSPEAKANRFQKGCVPSNKGIKGYHPNCTERSLERQKRTEFKKGHQPHNHKPVGSERVTRYGYLEVKVAEPNQWKLKHRVVWVQHHGSIPRGYNIQFKDGNSSNVAIENLYMISRSAQLKTKNSFRAKYPKDMQEIIMLRGALKRKLNSIKS